MLLLRLLAGPSLSIFAVGDDDQTIYGFSGATPEWLVGFEDHVPEAVHHALEVNYRCPAPVVTSAFNLMSHNRVRVLKVIRSGPHNVMDPTSLTVAKVSDQVQYTTDRVQLLIDGGAKPREIAVLSRVNALLVPVQVALIEAGIPVNLIDGVDFLKSTGVESVLAWLRLAVRPEQLAGSDIKLASRRPGRGIAPKVREWMGEQSTIEGLDRLARRMDEKASPKVVAFNRDIERIAKFAEHATTSDLIEFIRTDIGLDRALATLDASHLDQNGTSNSDSLRSLFALGRQHPDPRTFESWLKKLVTQTPDENGVVLATVHKVKGLEWLHVIVFDASDEIFPHRLSSDVEEERRVFHVAITRCVSSLTVTADSGAPSIFLNEMTAPGHPSRWNTRGPVRPGSAIVRSVRHQPTTSTRQPDRPITSGDRRTRTSLTEEVKTGSVEWRTKVQSENPKAYEPWSVAEDDSLKVEYSKGWSVARLAEAHQRRPGAIRSRLKKLGLRD